MTDRQLLQMYIEQASQDAFAQLVSRYLDMVYAAARRQVRDAHLAEDVAQAVFVLLARRAKSLKPDVLLAGWLYQAARLSASTALRAERRRKLHEKRAAEAQQMRIESQSSATLMQQIEPALDEAINQLGRRDREAIVLRFLQGRSMAETGQAIGVSEEAAKMRVHRAVSRLRGMLSRSSIVASSGDLMAAMASVAAASVTPVGLSEAAVLAATTKAGGGATAIFAIAKGANAMMNWMKIKLAFAVIFSLMLATTGTVVLAQTFLFVKSDPAARKATMPVAPQTVVADPNVIRVSVTFRQIRVEDQTSDWNALRRKIASIAVEQRPKIRLELSAVSGDVPVSAYFDAQAEAGKIVKEFGLAYLSLTGVQATPGDPELKGEYYIGGHIPRAGVYSLTGRKISVKQALLAAGLDEAAMADKVDFARRQSDGTEVSVRAIPVSELFDGSREDIFLMPNDQIMVTPPK